MRFHDITPNPPGVSIKRPMSDEYPSDYTTLSCVDFYKANSVQVTFGKDIEPIHKSNRWVIDKSYDEAWSKVQ